MNAGDHGHNLAAMESSTLIEYAYSMPEEEFFQEYIALSKEDQLVVFGKLDDHLKTMIWREYENVNKAKENPFFNLEGQELEEKYFGLTKEDQGKAWAHLDENQRKHVWAVFESRKAQEGDKQAEEKPKVAEETESDKIMKLTPNLRRPIIAGFSDDKLIQFYAGITKDQAKLTLWQEIDDRQKQVITTDHEIKKREKMLKDLEGTLNLQKKEAPKMMKTAMTKKTIHC